MEYDQPEQAGWKKELILKYPELFAQVGMPASESCMYWGIAVGDGWKDIIALACADLETLRVSTGAKIEFSQIKEKFGGLRLYLHIGQETEARIDAVLPSGVFSIVKADREQVWQEAHKITGRAEEESYRICEECGAPGEPRKGGWIRTLCNEHYNPKGKPNE